MRHNGMQIKSLRRWSKWVGMLLGPNDLTKLRDEIMDFTSTPSQSLKINFQREDCPKMPVWLITSILSILKNFICDWGEIIIKTVANICWINNIYVSTLQACGHIIVFGSYVNNFFYALPDFLYIVFVFRKQFL